VARKFRGEQVYTDLDLAALARAGAS